MSFQLKPNTLPQIQQLAKHYQQQYGTYLLDCLLVRRIVKKYGQLFKTQFSINHKHAQLIIANITKWWNFQFIVRQIRQNDFPTKEIYLQQLYLRPKIITNIAHISFTYLQKLQLDNCNLTSIENLSFMDCPRLVWLSLNTNLISSLKPISKTYFPKLNSIDLCKNIFPSQHLNNIRRTNLMKESLFHVHSIQRPFGKDPYSQRFFSEHTRWIRISEQHGLNFQRKHYIQEILYAVMIDFDKYFTQFSNDKVVQVHFSPKDKDWGEERMEQLKKLLKEYKKIVQIQLKKLQAIKLGQ